MKSLLFLYLVLLILLNSVNATNVIENNFSLNRDLNSNILNVNIAKDFPVNSMNKRTSYKSLTNINEILCSISPCFIEKETYVYYYHTAHLAYDSYYDCGNNFVCQTPLYNLAVSCLGFYDVYEFMIGFDAKPGFTFGDLDIYIDDQDVYFDLDDWKWYRYEEDVLLFSYLPAKNASLNWDFYLTDYANISDYLIFSPEKYFPNPDISCYFDCYQLYKEPYCYCNNSKTSETHACDAYGDLYSYYIDFETENGYWSIANVYLYLLHDSDLYETELIKFPNISQIKSANLIFEVAGDNPDELYEQGNFYVQVYDKNNTFLGTILDELITISIAKNIDIKKFLREDGIKFVFGNDFDSEYIIKNIRIEFVADCSDGTGYNSCSETKPLYCFEGNLINNCQVCGCEKGYGCRADGICVIFQADVNGDCKVDIFDLAKVGLCYGCSQGESCWNNCKNADLNNDDKINIFDLATVGLNYGKSC